jgi:DNA 3'-phosphatase
MQLNKAVFISLEGTLVKTKSGDQYPRDDSDWEFVSGLIPKLRYLVDIGYIPCIVSNQGGIGSGKITEQDIIDRLHLIDKELEEQIGTGVNNAYCPHLESYYRKPNPGMAYYFALELQLSLKKSLMIGNSNTDSHFAKEAHIGIYFDINSFIKDDITIYNL